SRCAATISQRHGTTASQADGFDRRHRRRARQARPVSVGYQPHGPASRRIWCEVITFRCVWRRADMGLGTAVWRCLYSRVKKSVDHAIGCRAGRKDACRLAKQQRRMTRRALKTAEATKAK